jgi:electron transport complex protein RnfA
MLATVSVAAENPLRVARIVPPDTLRVLLAPDVSHRLANFRLTAATAPDVPIALRAAVPAPGGAVSLVAEHALDRTRTYRVELRAPRAGRDVKPSPWVMTFTAILAAALINNFVFTRYLGLCIFFGVSKKRDTALGMGATFAMVMLTTGMLSWLLYAFVLRPLQLRFLQVLVFIGVVAFLVQMLDTVLKKTHRSLHQRFGIYLVLITTNCIILAVPLLNAAADAGPLESFALAMGSGLGFALALFLMSCARERVELAKVPPSFQGLPIAFALAGLFALAFMGFSGLSFLR